MKNKNQIAEHARKRFEFAELLYLYVCEYDKSGRVNFATSEFLNELRRDGNYDEYAKVTYDYKSDEAWKSLEDESFSNFERFENVLSFYCELLELETSERDDAITEILDLYEEYTGDNTINRELIERFYRDELDGDEAEEADKEEKRVWNWYESIKEATAEAYKEAYSAIYIGFKS